MTTQKVKFSAAWTPATEEAPAEVTVVRDVHAGISGPYGEYPAATLEEAVTVLFENGYLVTTDWEESFIGDHWATLTPMFPV